ncbi:MAG: hypothetical protein M8353_11600 [ANME-2 cluster archaeon]|nr:hypothetical protein [ANME-2 cluster archaeon]
MQKNENKNNKKPIPYIWLDEEERHPMMMGEPCTILFTESFASFTNIVQKIVGSGAGAILREVGYEMGKRYAELTFKQYPELRELDVETQILELCSIILRNTGWGTIEITNLDFENKSMLFRLCNHPSSVLEREDKEPTCHFEGGLVSGIIEVIFDEKQTAVDFSCEHESKCCNIRIKSP